MSKPMFYQSCLNIGCIVFVAILIIMVFIIVIATSVSVYRAGSVKEKPLLEKPLTEQEKHLECQAQLAYLRLLAKQKFKQDQPLLRLQELVDEGWVDQDFIKCPINKKLYTFDAINLKVSCRYSEHKNY